MAHRQKMSNLKVLISEEEREIERTNPLTCTVRYDFAREKENTPVQTNLRVVVCRLLSSESKNQEETNCNSSSERLHLCTTQTHGIPFYFVSNFFFFFSKQIENLQNSPAHIHIIIGIKNHSKFEMRFSWSLFSFFFLKGGRHPIIGWLRYYY